MNEYGRGGSFSVIMEGPFSGSGGTAERITTITALASNWKGGESPYSQIVSVDGVSVNSKIDLQMSVEQMGQLDNRYIAFVAENDGGNVTLYAIGDKPNVDCILQATISEVISI